MTAILETTGPILGKSNRHSTKRHLSQGAQNTTIACWNAQAHAMPDARGTSRIFRLLLCYLSAYLRKQRESGEKATQDRFTYITHSNAISGCKSHRRVQQSICGFLCSPCCGSPHLQQQRISTTQSQPTIQSRKTTRNRPRSPNTCTVTMRTSTQTSISVSPMKIST
jgi:hypothetical protein